MSSILRYDIARYTTIIDDQATIPDQFTCDIVRKLNYYIMTSTTFTNTDDNYYELGQEFKKLASLVPTIPKDECLSELEFIEIVIAYIRQLQQLLTHDQWSECLNKLASSMKNSLLSSTSSPPSSPHATNLLNQLIHESPRTQTNENSSIIRRSPLATINLDNTRLS
ncbi:unnamed protein product [Rotaria sordida]|uniref:BHLH domain-containing protein n=1 Tax=Rotaria sordida TaxID=392033 RepID=A0A815DH80_9BILA|nr:unnamed protein product [Rotaria sordida]CAF1300841.1 unnamed protein product [Rotaria sordida]CAF1301841.1 unnamed protein product [Rotaria sordida]